MDDFTVYSVGIRNIYFAGNVTDESMAAVSTKLMEAISTILSENRALKNYDLGHINLFITSDGGVIQSGFALIDLLLKSPIPIFTYCLGHAYSTGAIIFLAGARRIMGANAEIMIHDGYIPLASGSTVALEEEKQHLAASQQRMNDLILTRTCLKEKKLKEISEHKLNYYIDAKEAIKLNFATDIFDVGSWGDLCE